MFFVKKHISPSRKRRLQQSLSIYKVFSVFSKFFKLILKLFHSIKPELLQAKSNYPYATLKLSLLKSKL